MGGGASPHPYSIPDGRVNFGTIQSPVWKGEDLNNNGVRDQNTDGEWNETDFLANDSDVDGVLDGAETNGTYCFKGGSCANTAHPLLPLNADSDGDQLRDGQELAGWVVVVWYERTMEKKENRSVTSNPWSGQTDSDSDGMTDFEEFMNGSDPRTSDTDADGIADLVEIQRKSNITGIEGTPPQISNVHLDVGIDWDWWGFLYLPLRSHVTVSFDVSDNVGVARVDVRFIRYSGTEVVHLEWTKATAPTSYSFSHRFDFSIAEALVAGADVNITAFDVNENGAWGDFHVKSVLQAIADAIAAFLSAIAKVIMEAASFLINWIVEQAGKVIAAIAAPIVGYLADLARKMGELFSRFVLGIEHGRLDWIAEGLVGLTSLVLGDLLSLLGVIFLILQAVQVAITIATMGIGAVLTMLYDQLIKLAVGAIVGMVMAVAMEAARPLLRPLLEPTGAIFRELLGAVSGVLFPSDSRTSCVYGTGNLVSGIGAAVGSVGIIFLMKSAIMNDGTPTGYDDGINKRRERIGALNNQLDTRPDPYWSTISGSTPWEDPSWPPGYRPRPSDITIHTGSPTQEAIEHRSKAIDELHERIAGLQGEVNDLESKKGAFESYLTRLLAAIYFSTLSFITSTISYVEKNPVVAVFFSMLALVSGVLGEFFDINANSFARRHGIPQGTPASGMYELGAKYMGPLGLIASGVGTYLMIKSLSQPECLNGP